VSGTGTATWTETGTELLKTTKTLGSGLWSLWCNCNTTFACSLDQSQSPFTSVHVAEFQRVSQYSSVKKKSAICRKRECVRIEKRRCRSKVDRKCHPTYDSQNVWNTFTYGVLLLQRRATAANYVHKGWYCAHFHENEFAYLLLAISLFLFPPVRMCDIEILCRKSWCLHY
jgi:hypothetical protein